MNIILKKSLLLIPFIVFFLTACKKEYQYQASTGQGGSMARFTIAGNSLYVIDNRNLKVFDILQVDTPVFVTEILVGNDIETVFSHNNMLFIGSRTGMYIYDVSNPAAPTYISEVTHFISCDPVVVNDSLAFVTLRSGGDCRTSANVNQLEIYDITNPASPLLKKIYPMDFPHGLALDAHMLYVCHGEMGFGAYDVSNTDSIIERARFNDIHAFDVIYNNNLLLVIGETGFYQYNCANPDSIYLLSFISKGA